MKHRQIRHEIHINASPSKVYQAVTDGKSWHHFKLRFEHPPRWWIDIYLIDTVFRNIVAKYRNKLQLWRFHRRSAPDGSRHQFSFLCYTEDENLSRIRENIFNHSSVVLLEQSRLLIEKLHEARGSKIEDTSDPGWPVEIQKSWPYYIMGVSEMLINLIEELKPSQSSYDDNDIRSIEIYYSELNNRVSNIWHDKGSHAFLHHLNAIFGYFPLKAKHRLVDGANVVF